MELCGTPIAITGATGFLGRYITMALLDCQAHVVGVVRDPSRRPDLAAHGVELRVGDLRDEAALVRGFTGVDAIVANAGLIPGRGHTRYVEANVVGTENVMTAAHKAGVRRVVLVSSVAVYRFNRRNVAEDGELLSEHPRLLPMRAYRVSKLLGERAARRLALAYSLALTVVRPGQLYGAFDALLPTIRRLLQRPITFVPYGLRIPMAYGGDVAKAIVRCLEKDDTIGGTFNLTGPDRSAQSFVQAWREAGERVGRLRVPIPLPIHFTYNSERAGTELNFTHTSFRDALRETFAIEATARSRLHTP
jgi:nucleoside-diphosphate-sugar epimerase